MQILRSSRLAAPLGVAALLVSLGVLALAGSGAGAATVRPWIGVQGNQLVDKDGDPVRLLGVNRPGLEYKCIEGTGFFEGPSDRASILAMKSWHINAVRVQLNESCWLGHPWIQPGLSGAPYREAVRGFVDRLQDAGLYVILELQWAAPGKHWATGLIPMADADHALDFWHSLAAEYRGDRGVLFDLYNEPHDIDWACWLNGCEVTDQWFGRYRATGMQQLVTTVRSTGARQPILLGGLDWARDLSGWLEYLPQDPANALVASSHTYDYKPCFRRCRAVLLRIAEKHPVVTGELGQTDCKHDYVDPYMRWADRHGISYLGWAWYVNPELALDCDNGPILIQDYAGTPTTYGAGLRNHLRRLHDRAEREESRRTKRAEKGKALR
ncbi:MAG TPA: cellulase family glycosylhydrolase [Solirubrobacterales bacterium]|nr:cellulase family glycosylhydrolase [Solirubrobacterales bacterium]